MSFRYFIFAMLTDVDGKSGALVRKFEREEALPREQLRTLVRQMAAEEGSQVACDEDIVVPTFYELYPMPTLDPADTRPLLDWKVTVDFVSDDVKFGASPSDTFKWSEEPAGEALEYMTLVLIGDCLATRGSPPDNAEYCRILSRTVRRAE